MALLVEQTSPEAPTSTGVRVNRHTLYKRRWRATAEDGTELAVNLEGPVTHGTYLDAGQGRIFLIAQEPEDVLVIPLPNKTEMAAKIGWYLGNQHLPVEIRETEIILEHLATLAASLDRIGIPYTLRTDVFRCKMHSHQH